MKNLTRSQQAEMDEIGDRCAEAATALAKAVDDFNAALEDQRQALEDAKTRYNDELASMREFMEGLHGDADAYFSERSERWQEGETGQQYQQWAESMEGISELDEIDLEIPDPIEQPDIADWEDRSFLPAVSPDEM